MLTLAELHGVPLGAQVKPAAAWWDVAVEGCAQPTQRDSQVGACPTLVHSRPQEVHEVAASDASTEQHQRRDNHASLPPEDMARSTIVERDLWAEA